MIATAVVAGVLLVALMWRLRPSPGVARVLRSLPPPPGPPRPATVWDLPARWIGLPLRRVLRRPPDPAADLRLGVAVIAALAMAAVWPGLAPFAALGAWGPPALRRRRRTRAAEARLVDDLPDLVDLLGVAVEAGLTPVLAVRALAPRWAGLLGVALREAVARVDLGSSWTDALGALEAVGHGRLLPLVRALRAADRDGTALAPALGRVGLEARAQRRRLAEERAKRVPVRLLFPLVLCTLPAFALLTVVPLLVGSVPSGVLR